MSALEQESRTTLARGASSCRVAGLTPARATHAGPSAAARMARSSPPHPNAAGGRRTVRARSLLLNATSGARRGHDRPGRSDRDVRPGPSAEGVGRPVPVDRAPDRRSGLARFGREHERTEVGPGPWRPPGRVGCMRGNFRGRGGTEVPLRRRYAGPSVNVRVSSRRNQARATAQSRFTVLADTPRTSAVSSTLRPPK